MAAPHAKHALATTVVTDLASSSNLLSTSIDISLAHMPETGVRRPSAVCLSTGSCDLTAILNVHYKLPSTVRPGLPDH